LTLKCICARISIAEPAFMFLAIQARAQFDYS
jgi:hypothetical protein